MTVIILFNKYKEETMAQNKWLAHLAKVRKANPKLKDVAKIAKLAKKTYTPVK